MKSAVSMSVETLEPQAMDPKLLTEVERQEAVLVELPEDYEFPLFDGRQAIESQRKSAYKNTARAGRDAPFPGDLEMQLHRLSDQLSSAAGLTRASNRVISSLN